MARTYHVKKAQQRYATKPVIDPATGTQKQTPKMRNGVQMTTKSGRPVFVKITERDLTRPLPLLKCSKCGTEIQVGQPYKYTETFNRTIIRCGPCPVPFEWEYSTSLSARTAQIMYEGDKAIDEAYSQEDLEAARDSIAEAIRELAEEKEASSQNLEDGFGHETEQSMELADIADQLNTWADEVEGTDLPDLPDPEDEDCPECGGTGMDDHEAQCARCAGIGTVEAEEPSDDQMDEWLEQARDALREQAGACPV